MRLKTILPLSRQYPTSGNKPILFPNVFSILESVVLPRHEDFEKIYQNFIDQYGEEGEQKYFAWLNEHGYDDTKPMPKKESFSWVGDIQAVPGSKNLIRGEALHPLKTLHPEEWPGVRVYLEEELQKSAHTLADKPLLLDHSMLLDGKVTGAQYEDGAIEYAAQLNDPRILDLIRTGDIKHCSVEFEWESLEHVNGVAPKGIKFTALSLLKNFAPGDPLSTVELVEVWEGIVQHLKEAKMKEQDNQEPEKDEHGCIIGKERYDEKQDKCVPITIEQQGEQEPEKDEHGCLIGKERYDEEQGKCVPIEPATEQQGNQKPPEAGEPKPRRQRFMSHYGLTDEQMDNVLEWIGEDVYKLLPEPGTKRQQQAAEKKKGLGEAILGAGDPQQPIFVVPVKKIEAKMPSLQAERSMSYGAQRFVQDIKGLIHEAKEAA